MKLLFARFRGAVRPSAIMAMLLGLSPARLEANPTKPVVAQGTASVTSQGSRLTVQTSANAYINWGTFNIGVAESTVFVQPSASSVVWNRINDPNPSQILGHLDANGLVVLQNPSGFYVGGQATINAAGLIMTTAPTPPPDLSGGGMWQFSAPPPTASIINYGQINVGAAGPIFLIAHNIENHGGLTTPGGDIGLYAGKQVLVSSRPDGRGLSAQVSLPQGSVDNSGKLIADAGTIALHAQVVNQGGLLQANSIREQNGVIELVASDSLNLSSASVITAKGDTQGVSPGGNVLIQSGNKFSDEVASTIDVSGGAAGGHGGQVEISATQMDAIHSQIDGHAAAGSTGGRLLIDPVNIILSSTGTAAGSGTVNAGDPPAALTLNVNSFASFSQILLQASQNITLSTAWNLADSLVSAVLTLQAGNNIVLNNNLTAGKNWDVNLIAGADFVAPASVTPGVGSITLSGTATVQTQDGNINALAGNSISIANGAIRTVNTDNIANKGNINVAAATGSVNAGRNSTGYSFKNTGYTVSANLGGISTAAGGDVTITAGGDITSFLPTTTSTSPTDAGSGAFGPQPGVVTVKAGFNFVTGLPSATGGNVFGHFVAADSERNGAFVASTITALNGNAGVSGNQLALSLVKGGWQVNAPNGSINLQEVRNPNGVFNGSASGLNPFRHLFDYDPHSFVDLEAGNAVFLLGSLLPRYTADVVPVIYPPTLTINAGSGVTLGNNVTLFPSPFGELNVATGGSLEGSGFTLAMSDSGATKWTSGFSFATDHAAKPGQLNNFNPVVFNISGNMDSITITTPKETQITVGGEMDNTSFSGQNLHPVDPLHPAAGMTSINVTGRIFNQNVYSFVTLGVGLTAPTARFPGDSPGVLQVLQDAVVHNSGPGSANGGQLFPNLFFFYISQTKQIGYYGKMDLNTEQLLTGSVEVKQYGPDGKPRLDANGNYVTATISVPAALGVDPVQIQNLYAASQTSINPANAPTGFKLGGPGEFNITAQSMDLGAALGIVSEGPAINHALANQPGADVTQPGADINLTLTGNLDLFSSQISSLYGGNITITSGGAVNVGFGSLPLQDPTAAHGIWSSGPGNVTVIAQGDINVSGSRIAAFDGGNIKVISETGNVDAGSGGFNAVKVNEVVVVPGVVPGTFTVTTRQQPIAGSGILATTLPDAPPGSKVGDIRVETPRGSINASQGGIVQEPLNGNTSLTPTLTLIAGTRDAHGHVVYAGDINAGGSGVIGVNTILDAAGNINGLVIARGDSTVNAAANVSGTFLAGGTANFNAGGTMSGIAIAGNAINIGSGDAQGITALSQSVSGGGAASALASTSTASSSAQNAGAQQENAAQKADNADPAAETDEEDKKRKGLRPLLAKYVGRVTVILPSEKK